MKDDRDIIVLYYHPRLRSPTATAMYHTWEKECKEYRVVLVVDTGMGVLLQDVVKKWALDPDRIKLVYDGFGSYVGAYKSKDLIRKHDIKFMRTVGDVEVHMGEFGGGHHDMNSDMPVDIMYLPWTKDCKPPTDKLKSYTEHNLCQMDAEFLHEPFGVPVKPVPEDTVMCRHFFRPDKKTMDLLSCWLSEQGNPWQVNRQVMIESLKKWMNHFEGFAKFHEQTRVKPETDMNDREKGMMAKFGKERLKPVIVRQDTDFEGYARKVRATQNMFVDTSRRSYATQKYFEGGAAGCNLIGDQPKGYGDLFTDKTMTIIDPEQSDFTLPQILEDILLTEPGREDAIKKGNAIRRKIQANWTCSHWVTRMEQKLKEIL